MEDIAPELLAKIEQEFEEQFKADSLLTDLAAKLEAGTATHTEAYEYAGRVGEILTDAYQHNIASSSLPDGKLWYNIANRVLTPTMKNNYDIISKYVTDVQMNINKAAGLGIKAMPPDMDVSDKIQGIVNRVSSEESYDDVKWILQEPVKTFGRNVVDSSIRANVEFQGKAGLTPKIVRKTAGSCCKWCTALAGTYTYPDVPRDVYRRHDNCRCVVNYDPGNGKIQNVHSGKEGKRRYVQDKYGGYTKTKEARIAHAKEMAATEEARKAAAREKRITTGAKEKGVVVQKGKDVTSEFKDSIEPKKGTVSYDNGYSVERHKTEIKMAQWIHEKLGGDIQLLEESDIDGVMRPDYLWNGKYWELKSVTTEKAANSAIRKGIKQIKGNPGGIILHYKERVDLQEVIKVIEKRVNSSRGNENSFDIMIVQGDKLIKVIRY